MKILVVGLSPCLITSRSRLVSILLRYLYFSKYQVGGLVWGHDPNFFPPNEDGTHQFEFELLHSDDKLHTHKIPLSLFNRGEKEVVAVYEIIKSLQPDIVITAGDYGDFLYMKAIKDMLPDAFKWMWVLSNYSAPINEHNEDLMKSVDAVLCTSEYGFDTIKNLYEKDLIETEYCFSNATTYYPRECKKSDKFRIMASGKNQQADNLPTIMEAVANARQDAPDIELYLHANVFDKGDYDLEQLKGRFDPHNEFISFPEKYVSIFEGVLDTEMAIELSSADLFVSVPLVSATSMTVFDAVACGCFPIMSDCGSNSNVADLLEKHFKGKYRTKDFLVKCSNLMAAGGTYLSVCDVDKLTEKILKRYRNSKKNKGDSAILAEFTQEYTRERFLDAISSLLSRVSTASEVLCLDA